MKRLINIFLLAPVAFGIGFTLPGHSGNRTQDSNGILLVYVGNISSLQVGIHVEIDSSTGVRYEVAFENGSNVMSHTALFYKFSDPTESVIYNYLTHKSKVIHCCGPAGTGQSVKAVGTAVIDSFPCTHLQSINYGESGGEDYWVSTQVPGYSTLLNVLNGISPGMEQMFIEGNIFQWGGLVKMTERSKNGMVADIKIVEANSTMSFPANDFEVPSH